MGKRNLFLWCILMLTSRISFVNFFLKILNGHRNCYSKLRYLVWHCLDFWHRVVLFLPLPILPHFSSKFSLSINQKILKVSSKRELMDEPCSYNTCWPCSFHKVSTWGSNTPDSFLISHWDRMSPYQQLRKGTTLLRVGSKCPTKLIFFESYLDSSFALVLFSQSSM